MRPRWRKVLADLSGNLVRSLLVTASIAVGLFAVGLIDTVHVVLGADMVASYAAVNPANIQVRAPFLSSDFVARVENLPGVRAAEGARVVDMRVLTGPEEWKQINLMSKDDFGAAKIAKVDLVEGKWPPGRKEIVLDVNKFPDVNARIGDTLQIKLPSGVVRELKLVGIVHDQTIGSASGGGGFFLAPIQGYISFDTLTWMQLPESYNVLYVTTTGDPQDLAYIRTVMDRIMVEFDRNGLATFSSVVRRTSDHPNITYLDAMSAVLYLLGLLVVFLSGFLITNTLSALLNQQMPQVGVMKTVGANRRQVAGVYVVLILTYSLLALAISVPLAYQASFAILRFLSERINFNLQGARFVPSTLLTQAAIALIVPQVAGAIPILKGAGITIQQALSGIGSNTVDDRGRLMRALTRLRGVSRPLLISLRNTFRRRVRLILTLLTLTLGGAIFISTFNVRASIDNYVERLRRYFVADVNLTFNRPYRIEQVARDVAAVSGVTEVEGWAAAGAEVVLDNGKPGEAVQLLAPPADSRLLEPIVLQGRWIVPGDQNALAVSELFLEKFPGLKPGDRIRLRVNGDETDWVVVGIFQFAGRAGGMFGYASYDYLSRLIGTPGQSSVFRVVAADGMHTLPDQQALSRVLESRLEGEGYQVADVRAGKSLQASTTGGLNILTTFLLIMATLMAMVGSIGLMGTMSLNVLERTREIGVMRAVGASDRAITGIVLVEGMLIGLISWGLSVLAAFPISRIMSEAINNAIFGSGGLSSYTPEGIFIWLGLVLLLSVLASVLPARNAARLTIREVLSYE